MSENSLSSAPQLSTRAVTPRNILNATLEMTSAVSRRSGHLPTAERARNSSINRTPMRYPLWRRTNEREARGTCTKGQRADYQRKESKVNERSKRYEREEKGRN